MAKQSIGDNVYAEYMDNHVIKLSVGDHLVEILLTPDTLCALGEFAMKEAKAHAN